MPGHSNECQARSRCDREVHVTTKESCHTYVKITKIICTHCKAVVKIEEKKEESFECLDCYPNEHNLSVERSGGNMIEPGSFSRT
jgi:hypothetical protein